MALTADDRVEILDLMARFCQAYDSRDGPAWADTFTDDGLFQGRRQERHGRRQLERQPDSLPEHMRGMRIWTTNHVIDGDGDSARLTCYFLVLLRGREFKTEGKGTYQCELRKVDGSWRFSSVRTALDG
jgi:ketosteroid isomerase-like protein